jgi:hypothetical protein
MIKIFKATSAIIGLIYIDSYLLSYLPESPFDVWWAIPTAVAVILYTIVAIGLIAFKAFQSEIKL